MTNGDFIRQMDDFDLGQFLCHISGSHGCEGCVANGRCEFGHNAMMDILKEEYKQGNEIDRKADG